MDGLPVVEFVGESDFGSGYRTAHGSPSTPPSSSRLAKILAEGLLRTR